MATWKKVIVSGSNISQLTNDSLYIHTGSDGVGLTGSFTGSFFGDGSGLTGVTAAGTLSSSAQIASDISGAFGTDSGSFSTRITSVEATVGSGGLLSSSAQIADEISGSFNDASSSIAIDIDNLQSDSGSFSTRVTDLESFSASLDATFATEAELHTATASLSSSIATDIAALELFSSSLSSTVISYTGSFSGDGSGLEGITVTQNATVTASFSNAATASVTHNFDSDNIIVVVYDDQDEQFIPSTIKAVSGDVVEIHFTPNATGRAIVARGGHIVSGSIPFENIIAKPANLVSGSGQILVVTTGSGVISGSSQIAELGANILSSSAQIASDVSGSVTDLSSSIETRLVSIEGSVGAGGLLSSSAQIASDISGSFTDASSSIATDIVSLDSSKADKTAVTGAFYADSGSFSTRVTSLETSVGAGGLLSSSAQIAADISGSFVDASASLAADIVTNANNIASNDVDIAGLNTYTSSLKTAITVAGANVTIAGNLEVSGTTTTVDSTTVTFSDNIIALNGTGAANGGIEVNDANGPASGSLLWDGTNNQWIAGGQGSETKIFTKGGNDGLLSGSAQIALNISGAFADASSSIATEIDALQASVGGGGLLSSSAQIASDISGSFTDVSSSIATDIVSLNSSKADKTAVTGAFTDASSSIATDIDNLQADSGSFSTRVTDLETFSSSLDATFATEAELNTATASLSSSLATDIAQNKSDLANLTSGELNSGSFNVTLKANTGSLAFTEGLEIGDVYDQGNGTTDIRVPAGASWVELNYGDTDFIYLDGTNAGINLDNTYEWTFYGATGTMIAPGEIRTSGTISGSKFVLTGGELLSGSAQLNTITGVAAAISGAFGTDSGSFSTRVTDLESFSASLDATFATEAELNTATASLSSSIATDIAGLVVNSASFATDILALEADSGSFSTRVTDLELFSSSLDTSFVTEAELVAATASLSSSIATDIAELVVNSASFAADILALEADSGSFSTRVTANEANIATLEGKSLVSASVLGSTGQGEVRLTTNGVDGSTIDLGLQTTDTPTFAGLTVTGDLVVTGNTIEAQVTNLNIEDKYILLNSGSSTIGDSGIVFGGSSGVANSGAGLFWDASYNSNDGRLAIIGAINAGSTGDQSPSYHVAGVFEGSELFAGLAKADHPGNIRIENGEVFIYI